VESVAGFVPHEIARRRFPNYSTLLYQIGIYYNLEENYIPIFQREKNDLESKSIFCQMLQILAFLKFTTMLSVLAGPV